MPLNRLLLYSGKWHSLRQKLYKLCTIIHSEINKCTTESLNSIQMLCKHELSNQNEHKGLSEITSCLLCGKQTA